MFIGDFPEMLSQEVLAGIIGRLGVCGRGQDVKVGRDARASAMAFAKCIEMGSPGTRLRCRYPKIVRARSGVSVGVMVIIIRSIMLIIVILMIIILTTITTIAIMIMIITSIIIMFIIIIIVGGRGRQLRARSRPPLQLLCICI